MSPPSGWGSSPAVANRAACFRSVAARLATAGVGLPRDDSRRPTRLKSNFVHVSAIIAAGGRGSRFGGAQPKQLQPLAGDPILKRTVDALLNGYAFDEVVVASVAVEK